MSATASWARSPTGRCGSTSSSSDDRDPAAHRPPRARGGRPPARPSGVRAAHQRRWRSAAPRSDPLRLPRRPCRARTLCSGARSRSRRRPRPLPANDPAPPHPARADLGTEEVNRRLVQGAGLGALLVDTGHRPGEVVEPSVMARIAARPAYSVSRIERVAEMAAAASDGPGDWLAALGDALNSAAASSAGFKTVVADRGGYALDPAPPSGRQVHTAAEAWFSVGAERLSSAVLLRHVLHVALDAAASHAIPVQAHAGFGDTDLTLHLADPSVFTPWVRE